MADRKGSQGALTYDPGRDAAARFPDWVIRHRPLSHGIPEVMCRRRKVILIASQQTWPAKRCSLAHAVAHLDLAHTAAAAGYFGREQEDEANQLAARRLIDLHRLGDLLRWTREYGEIAAELDVDIATLKTREQHLHVSERAYLRRATSCLEEIA